MEQVYIFRRGGISITDPSLAVQDWQAKFDDLENIADGLGHGLDSGIKRTVLAIQLMGLETRLSCEGHTNWAHAAPNVFFEVPAPLPQELQHSQDMNLLSEDDERMINQEIQSPYSAKIYWNLKQHWLDIFYKDRHFDSNIALEFEGTWSDGMEIGSLGRDFSQYLGPTERNKFLKASRQEMSDFTDFVLDKLFEGNIPQAIQDLPQLTEQPLQTDTPEGYQPPGRRNIRYSID